MLIWKNTATLDRYDEGLQFTGSKKYAEIALLGSKPINIADFSNLKGIFRAGIGKDNVPIKEAKSRSIVVKFPSERTIKIIFEETANFTCGLIMKMMYTEVGSINLWIKNDRTQLSAKTLLVIGMGNIGKRVAKKMNVFMEVITFDILENNPSDLENMINNANCITLHIPKSDYNVSFFDKQKLSWIKDGGVLINTARGAIVDENALYKDIKSGRIKAAFDVYWQEPYEGILKEFHPESFYMSPHVASTCSGFLEGCREDLNKLIIGLKNK